MSATASKTIISRGLLWGMSPAARWLWLLVLILASSIGVFSLRYGLPQVPLSGLENFATHRTSLVVHALFASIALIIGPWQFLPRLRERHPALHRINGRVYVTAVLVGWAASVPIALNAQTGLAASAGFLGLGAAWFGTTAVAVWLILRGEIARHRRWMIRSYFLTASAITLRIYLGTGAALQIPFGDSYPAIAWLCWVPNLIAAELYLRFFNRAAPSRTAYSPTSQQA